MIRKLLLSFLSVLVLFQLAIASGMCASDGSTGTTSTGSTDLSLSIANLVRISNVADMNFGTYSGSGDAVLDDDVCIWTNVAAGTYKIKATGDGASNAYTVSNGLGGTLAYTVKWNNTTGTSGNFALTTATFSTTLTGASTTSTTCGGGTNANFQIRILQSTLLSSRPGVFTGVLTLIVSP